MGKHDRHRTPSHDKDWLDRTPQGQTDPLDPAEPGEAADPESDLADDEDAAGMHSRFAREIKIGLGALGVLLLVLVGVVWSRLRRDETPPPPEKVAGLQSSQPASSAPEAPNASAAKAPRELTATEPKQPFLPPRSGSAMARQTAAFGSDSPGSSPTNPFGPRGGPSFMPKVANPAGTASAQPASGPAGKAPGFVWNESPPPEPPGEAVTVGEGPIDPFRSKPSALPPRADVAAASPLPSAAIGPRSSTGAPRSTEAGFAGSLSNPLRTAEPLAGRADTPARQASALDNALSKPATAAQPPGGLNVALPQQSPSVQGSEAGVPAAMGGSPLGGMAGMSGAASRAVPSPARLAASGADWPVRSVPAGSPAGSPAAAASAVLAAPRPTGQASRVYIVKDGDTLYDIARNELGKASRWGEIYDLNWDQLGNRVDGLVPGMKLRLPDDPGQPAGVLSRNPNPPGPAPTLQR